MCLQPPPANLDSLFLYIEDVIDVSTRLLSLLDQKQVQPGDPVFLQTLCKGDTIMSVELLVLWEINFCAIRQWSDAQKQHKHQHTQDNNKAKWFPL